MQIVKFNYSIGDMVRVLGIDINGRVVGLNFDIVQSFDVLYWINGERKINSFRDFELGTPK